MAEASIDATDHAPAPGVAGRPGDPGWYVTSMHPDAVAWREQQADVDADIEGLARDERADEVDRQLQAAGVPPEERIARLKAYFQAQDRQALAAE